MLFQQQKLSSSLEVQPLMQKSRNSDIYIYIYILNLINHFANKFLSLS